MPLPLGTALSQPLLPVAAAQAVQQAHPSSVNNAIQSSNFHTAGQHSVSQQHHPIGGNIQSIIGLAPGSLQHPPNHLNNITSTSNSNLFNAVGGNLNSLSGRSSTNSSLPPPISQGPPVSSGPPPNALHGHAGTGNPIGHPNHPAGSSMRIRCIIIKKMTES